MKKLMVLVLFVLMVGMIAACGGKDEAEKEEDSIVVVGAVEEVEANTNEEDVNVEEENEEEQTADDGEDEEHEFVKEFNDEIHDSEDVKIVLKEIERRESSIMKRGYYITLEVQNKLDKNIFLRTDGQSSADDKMINNVVFTNEPIEGKSTKLLSYL